MLLCRSLFTKTTKRPFHDLPSSLHQETQELMYMCFVLFSLFSHDNSHRRLSDWGMKVPPLLPLSFLYHIYLITSSK
jgi:hypothetical protein